MSCFFLCRFAFFEFEKILAIVCQIFFFLFFFLFPFLQTIKSLIVSYKSLHLLIFIFFSSYSYWIISVNLSSGFWFFLLLSQIWYGNSSKFWFQLLFLKLQFLFCYHKTSIFVLIFLIQWHVIIILSFNSLEMTSFSSLNIFLIAHLDLLYSKSSICAL